MDETQVVADVVEVAEFVTDLVAEVVRVALVVRLLVAVVLEDTVFDAVADIVLDEVGEALIAPVPDEQAETLKVLSNDGHVGLAELVIVGDGDSVLNVENELIDDWEVEADELGSVESVTRPDGDVEDEIEAENVPDSVPDIVDVNVELADKEEVDSAVVETVAVPECEIDAVAEFVLVDE